MMSIEEDIELERLAVLVASKRRQMDRRSELEARRVSREAIRRSGERVPPGLSENGDLELLRATHANYWLRSSECLAKSLDPLGIGTSGIHVVSFDQVKISAPTLSGFHIPGESIFRAVRHHLPRTARPAPVVFLNVENAVRHHARPLIDKATESSIRESVRVALAAVTVHEVAHVAADAIVGLAAPDDVDESILRVSAGLPQSSDAKRERHDDRWIRAILHLGIRASRIFPSDYTDPPNYIAETLTGDVEFVFPGFAADLVDALSVELIATAVDEPLREILSRPAPPSFVETYRRAVANTERSSQ